MNTSASSLTRYYDFHARIYDATRWSFLFGREALLRQIRRRTVPARILEIGCGTGHNLELLSRFFPEAELTGIDLSEAMLAKAREKLAAQNGRVKLVNAAYDAPVGAAHGGFDLIIASYALSMFNPGWEQALQAARSDLAPKGRLAVVDFHDARMPGFARWMQVNHVRMEGHLQEALDKMFQPEVNTLHRAYGGVWRYLHFIGQCP